MASACVNNIGMSSEKFLDYPPAKFPSYGWLSPRISFSREFPDDDVSKGLANKPPTKNQQPPGNAAAEKPDEPADLESSGNDFVDFEFRLVDPVMMLPADELFANGKLVPLHLSNIRHSMTSAPASSDVRFPDTPKFRRRNEVSPMDPYLFSPKAPRCSSRWKELLGLKKLYQSSNAKQEDHKTASSLPAHSDSNKKAVRSLKHLIQRSSKSSLNASSIDSSLNLPLLKDSDSESVSISSRLSLSSSSSGHEHDDLPRLSLDSDKPSSINTRNTHHHTARNISRARVLVKHRTALSSENPTVPTRVGRSPLKRAPESSAPVRGVSVDSPRMNSYGQIVFHSLERSSSSPSTFNGGPRHKHRGMERSYSANVRITPVLNVPVCSLRGSSKSGVFGFPLFYSQQKKENGGTTINGLNKNHQHQHSKNRTDRT